MQSKKRVLTTVAVHAVEELHRLTHMVHVSSHTHEGKSGRAEERLGLLDRADPRYHLSAFEDNSRLTNLPTFA